MKALVKLATTIIVAIVIFGSCTSQKELMYLSNLDTTTVQQFYPMIRPDYRVQYQDILYVNFFTMNQEMNDLLNPGGGSRTSSYLFRDESSTYIYGYTVSDSGTISLPILGEIEVYGLTLEQVKRNIKERAAKYLKDAVINVRLLSFKYTVVGEVNRPGMYNNYNNQLTVLEAIGMAGDITDYGNRRRVLVVRPTKEGTYTFRINLQDKNLLQSEGYFLLPNDIVIVEPIKSKPFQLNIPITSLLISTTLSTISTLILLINFINITK
ncbi:MAG: polysaccharide biosynthesis/export family protein [Bacteroidales bacterium]|nr:polysaccharide biosynthesis/export family protein [Bacteroidales bacterium]